MSRIPPYNAIRNSYTETVVNLLRALENYQKCSAQNANLKNLSKKRAQALMLQLIDSYLSNNRSTQLDEADIDAIIMGIETITLSYNASVSENLRIFPNGFKKDDLLTLDLTARRQSNESPILSLR